MIRARLDVARNNASRRGEGRAQNSVRLNKSKDFEKMCLLALAISSNSVKINEITHEIAMMKLSTTNW